MLWAAIIATVGFTILVSSNCILDRIARSGEHDDKQEQLKTCKLKVCWGLQLYPPYCSRFFLLKTAFWRKVLLLVTTQSILPHTNAGIKVTVCWMAQSLPTGPNAALNSHVGYGGATMNISISTNVDLGDPTAFSPHREKVLILGAVKAFCGAAAFGRELYYQSGFFDPTSGFFNHVFCLDRI